MVNATEQAPSLMADEGSVEMCPLTGGWRLPTHVDASVGAGIRALGDSE